MLMCTAEEFIKERLQQREQEGLLRKLSADRFPIDFCSNDYLGFARSERISQAVATMLEEQDYRNGSGGSRLISGNSVFTETTEADIATFHNAETALLFNSGYDANTGLLSCLAQRGDTIVMDELSHASLIDGARLSYASRYTFRHNDCDDLEARLRNTRGRIYVVTESVFSMDGDLAPLLQMAVLCRQYGANLVVDEAHALGITGPNGRGLVQQLRLEKEVFARIVTFGKALGCHGAAVLGSVNLRNYLINFARSFIYTTAAPVHSVAAIACAYRELERLDYQAMIQERIGFFSELYQAEMPEHNIVHTPSAIQTVQFNHRVQAKAAAMALQQKGIDIRAILSPTVPAGKERLRICLHTFNTDQEIEMLITELSKLKTT